MDNYLINQDAGNVIGITAASKLSDIATVGYSTFVSAIVAGVLVSIAVSAIGITYASARGSFQDVSKYKSFSSLRLKALLALILVSSVFFYVLPNFNFLDLSSDKKGSSAATLSGPTSKGTTQNVVSASCGNVEQIQATLSSNGGNVCAGARCDKTCVFSPELEKIVLAESSRAGVDYSIVLALICRESSGNPRAEGKLANNGRPDCGLMQINSAACTPDIMDPATNIRLGIDKYKNAYFAASSYSYPGIQKQSLAFAAYNCCAGKDNPNSKSDDCNTSTGWVNDLPKWACPKNPGEIAFNMCAVKNYACTVTACAAQYAGKDL